MPRKICIITGRFPGRAETFVVEHAVGLAHRGYEVCVISQGIGPGITAGEIEALDATGVKRIQITAYRSNRIFNASQMVKRLLRRPKLLQYLSPKGPWTRPRTFR